MQLIDQFQYINLYYMSLCYQFSFLKYLLNHYFIKNCLRRMMTFLQFLKRDEETKKEKQRKLRAILYNNFTTAQGNVVWAGALNLAFNDFKNTFLSGNELKFKGISEDSEVGKLLYPLNNAKFTSENISQQSIYVKSGLGRQIAELINNEVKAKFPFKTTPALNEDIADTDYISYAYIFKGLVYEHEFERIPGILWFGKRIVDGQESKAPYMVEAFSAESPECLSQIKIIEYNGRNDFFVGFKAKQVQMPSAPLQSEQNQVANPQNQEKQSIFIKFWNYVSSIFSNKTKKQFFNDGKSADVIYILSAKEKEDPNEKEMVFDVVDRVIKAQEQKKIDDRPSEPNLNEFSMPVIDLDLKHEYEQFKGLQIENSKLRGSKLKIIENIKLMMDEKGVVVENDAFMGKDECAISGSIEINIQNPFWLVLTEQNKHPYLVVKINYLPEKHLDEGRW